jgi:hypothetical protein
MGGAVTLDLRSEHGMTLVETVIATSTLLVMLVSLLSMGALATMYTENHGHLEARTTEYAQDKMEQLLGLAYTDTTSDTTSSAVPYPATGSGLAVGGGANTSAPVNQYVDWLAASGTLLGGGTAAPSAWFYERVWQITVSGTVKQITVVTTVRTAVGGELKPKSTITVLKTSRL